MRAVLHVTNGDSAAGSIRQAAIGGEVLAWRDVLHDGPVPGGLSLQEMSGVRAKYLASDGMGDLDDLLRDFASRDRTLKQIGEYDRVVLWFEWDLYDQLQLIQILDAIAGLLTELKDVRLPAIEMVSVAGYLGTMPIELFPALYEKRIDVSEVTFSLGQAAWRAFTSSDPRNLVALLATDTSELPFLEGALWRHLEELPSVHEGLSRAERQLLEGIVRGASQFGDLFDYTATHEERIYCGDASAARYLERLSRGQEPLIVYQSGETVRAPRTEAESAVFRSAELSVTEAGAAVLAGSRDWIEIGGSDRWLGGVRLDGRNAAWRWDPEKRSVIEATGA